MFWVHASNAARVEQGYRDIAERAKISGRDEPRGNIFDLVNNWLRTEKKEKWALILDNADDALLFETHDSNQTLQTNGSSNGLTQPLSAYLPQSENGSILVTTRNKSVALHMVEESEVFMIEPMNDSDALALLEKKLGGNIEKNDAVELVEALEFMPLAIIQAAAYIRQRGPRSSIKEYLKEFHKNDHKKTSLLNQEAGHLRRDQEAKNSIMITWQISFDHILKARTSAADLLSLMSFFDRQGIPENLIKTQNNAEYVNRGGDAGNDEGIEGGEHTVDDKEVDGKNDSYENSISVSSLDDEFETDILTLRNYSFITASVDGTIFEMHRLVQLAIRKWLETRDELEKWKQKFIKTLCAEFPTTTEHYENWTKFQTLFPHVKSAEAQRPVVEHSLWEWAVLLCRAAFYLQTKGAYAEAETMASQGTLTMRRIRGQEDEETLLGMDTLSVIYGSSGQWKKAEKLLNEVIELKTKVYGAEHVETGSSIFNLASTYRERGRLSEAEVLQVQVMNTYVKVLGTEHSHTLHSMNNLAMTYLDQGRWEEAETLQMQVMKAHTSARGTEHPFALTSMNNLAMTWAKQGRWKEAEALQLQAMNTQMRVLGAEHPNSLNTMNNLAWTYRDQRRFQEAEALHMRVMSVQTRVLGAGHPSTLINMNNLALIYMDQQRYEQAEALQTHVLNAHKSILGTEHPYTLITMGRLALTYWNQYRLQEAEEFQTKVLDVHTKVSGPEHPHTLISMNNLAHTYKAQGRVREAIDLLKKYVELQRRKLGTQHPQTRDALEDLEEWMLASETLKS